MKCLFLWLAALTCLTLPCAAAELAVPVVHDDRIQVELFAREPEIVTPVGAVCDDRGRLFVIESHTHGPDKDYAGPQSDRIKVYEDADGDGRADTVSVYADGFDDAMNLAFSPAGALFVCHRRGVVRLADRDGDGVSDARSDVLRYESPSSNLHGGLLGLAFSHDGWMYVSRGHDAGTPYTLRGGDAQTITGYGDGGNIVRCRPDGSRLELVATGFWNPFAMEFDRQGRLLAVDNDPDSRGPNRLVHVLSGGDYGYKAIYGPSGLHPFQSWNGELPGTLPMIAGTGEAPSGLMDASRAALRAEYHDNVIVTIWREHTIERFSLKPQGTSLTSQREVWISGGNDFRPVGITAAPDGAIYVTDWVRKDYPNHGCGRIWRIAKKAGVQVTSPRAQYAAPRPDEPTNRLGRLLSRTSADDFDELGEAVRSDDAFVRSAAVTSLARPVFHSRVRKALGDRDPDVRIGALLALRRAGERQTDDELRRLLRDESLAVRKAAQIASQKSLMPDGLEHQMTRRDLRNLLAFLESCQ